MLQVLLPAEFRDDHWRLVLAWLHRGHEFNQTSWTQALDAFDLLKNAALLTSTGLIPFPVVYRQQVDDRYADAFIARLYAIEPAALARESVMAWSEVARRLEADLLAAGLVRHDSLFHLRQSKIVLAGEDKIIVSLKLE